MLTYVMSVKDHKYDIPSEILYFYQNLNMQIRLDITKKGNFSHILAKTLDILINTIPIPMFRG